MIVKSNSPSGDHYHECADCGIESTPEDCSEPAIDCVDLPCANCERIRREPIQSPEDRLWNQIVNRFDEANNKRE